jgi:hypothetical protein
VARAARRRAAGAELRDLVELARGLGFARVHVELRLAKLDLAALPALAEEVRALRAEPPAGLHVDVATS